MAFLNTNRGLINERFIIRLRRKDDRIAVIYLLGTEVAGARATIEDARELVRRDIDD